jgi:hypothetical protein
MFYIVGGAQTGATEAGDAFLAKVHQRVSPFHPACMLTSPAALSQAHPSRDDGVAFVIGRELSADATRLLSAATASGSVILPIALDQYHRQPPDEVGIAQSFDVVDALRRGSQPPGQTDWAARAFVREALSRLAPTCFRARLRVFLSYRRLDGEGSTAELDRELSTQHQYVFRDLPDIQVGDPASEVIDRNLRDADVVVFMDTPLAGESEWVACELATAMGNGTPVVWVRIGPPDGRTPLRVQPGGAPQLELNDPANADISRCAAEILDAALDQVGEAIRASASAFASVSGWADQHAAVVATLDQRRMIYAITFSTRPDEPFPRRVRRDIVQLFARNPDQSDVEELRSWLRESGYVDHPVSCRAFDAAVLLRPATMASVGIDDWGVVASTHHYLGELGGLAIDPTQTPPTELLLLGAFPAEPTCHPAVISAVSALARSWLELGGSLRFGSHPTFTPLIVEAARSVLPRGVGDRIHAFRSDYFVDRAFELEDSEHVAVHPVQALADRESSLAALRREMIRPGSAALAVIIGGRTSEGGSHVPGVEEELALARESGIPVVVLASPGGQAVEIAERERSGQDPWAGLGNGLSEDVNKRIAFGDDYAETARTLWETFHAP